MLPAVWMVLTDVIAVSLGSKMSPFPRFTPNYVRGHHDIQHRVTHLDRILTLDSSVWAQVNNAQATYLFQTLIPPSCHSEVWMRRPVGILAFCKPIILPLSSTLTDDCWMADFTPCAYGPSSVTIDALKGHFAATTSISPDDPSAFMFFSNRPTTRHPVIFDTGASLAITPDKTDFDGQLTIPKGDLRLEGDGEWLENRGDGFCYLDVLQCFGCRCRRSRNGVLRSQSSSATVEPSTFV